jgi:Protein of unknown function (DUF3352)
MRKLLLTLAVLSTMLLAATGCGNEEEAASSALELVPAGASVYGEATIRPEGDQKEAVDTILSKFPGGGEAGEKLKGLLEKAFRESDTPISFREDIEPWLGDNIAFFVSDLNPQTGKAAAAALIATEDEDQAQSALEKSAEGKITRKTYKDVEYMIAEGEDGAAGVLEGFVVIGTELGVKAAIDASEGGEKLSDDEAYNQAIDGATDDRLGFVYVDGRQLFRSLPAASVAGFEGLKDAEPFVATFDADDDGVLVEAEVSEEVAKTFGAVGDATELLTGLPADSWFATAQGNFGETLDGIVASFAQSLGGRDVIDQQFKAATGLDLRRDVIAWMGGVAMFARGESLDELDGALIIETTDEAASGRLIAAVAQLARTQGGGNVDVQPFSAPGGGDGISARIAGVPKPIHLFQGSGRVVLAYGDAAAKDAVDPSEKLGDSAEFSEARDSLGSDYEVSFLLRVAPILAIVDSTEAASDADWQEAKRYLEPLSTLVAGSADEGDKLKTAFKLVIE